MKILTCRIDGCDERDRFSHIQAVNASDWTEISPMSITTDTGDEMRGYCPDHSVE
jgi:hypothetical protein